MANTQWFKWLADNHARVESTTWRLLAEVDDAHDKILEIFDLQDMPIERSMRTSETQINPEDVGKIFNVHIEGEDASLFQLTEFNVDGKHKIKWFYTIDQAPDVEFTEIQSSIDKVHSIGGIAVVESNHVQNLEGNQWEDVTSQILRGFIPNEPIDTILYYVVGEIDVESMCLVNDNAAFIVNQLLTIGPDNGAFLKDNIDSIGNFRRTRYTSMVCDACKLNRTISKAFDCDGQTWRVGRICAAKIELAVKINNEKDSRLRLRLIDDASTL